MALIDNIPMPTDPGSSFFQGATATQNILSKILEGKQNQQKLSQDALSNEQLNKYRMGQLGIARMAENRAQTMLPYLLQSYKDTHNREASEHEIQILKNNLLKQQYQEIISGLNLQGQPEQVGQQQPQQAPLQSNPMGGQGGLNYTPIENPISNPTVKQNDLRQTLADDSNETSNLHNMMGSLFDGTGKSPIQQPQAQSANPANVANPVNKQNELASMMQPLFEKNYGAQQPGNNQATSIRQTGQSSQLSQPDQSGMQEITLRPSKKGMALSDKLAGTPFGQPIKTHIGKDGWVYSEYPSGKITAVRNPQMAQQAGKETPEEKRAAELKNKKEFEQFKTEEKNRENKDKELTATWKALAPTMTTINTLSNIINKNPKLTGRGTQFAQWAGLTDDPDVGTFSSGALELQTALTKDLSSRGGYGAAKIVQGAKPDIKNSTAFNQGALKQMKDKSIRTFVAMKKEFNKNHPGQDFPYKLSDYYPEVIIEKPNGEKITLPADGAVKLLEDHPNHKIAG